MLGDFSQLSLESIKAGFTFDANKEAYVCLACGKEFEVGEVFAYDDRFYEAAKAVKLHVAKEHGSMLETLLSQDKKYTGLTENQKELMRMFSQGMSDNDIAKKLGVASSTIRHQRFAFREKAKQAKLYLAIFEMLEEAMTSRKDKAGSSELVEVHQGAKMVDDRYVTTKAEEEKIIASAFASLSPLKLKVFSPKEKKKIVILRTIAAQFERNKRYSEKELNEILKSIYEDFATVRRYLIEYGFMDRTKDCKEYWLK